MQRRRGKAHTNGFSIIEALLAFVVLLIAVVGLLSVLPFSFGNIETNADDVQAQALAQQYMDTVRAVMENGLPSPSPTTAPISAGNSMVANVSRGNIGNFTVQLVDASGVPASSCPPAPPTVSGLLLDCHVQVSWTEQGTAKKVTVQSYVAAF